MHSSSKPVMTDANATGSTRACIRRTESGVVELEDLSMNYHIESKGGR